MSFEFRFTIELTPKMELVTSRNWAIRYRFASVKSPVGGTIKPAMEKATATMNDAVAIFACRLLRVMGYYYDCCLFFCASRYSLIESA